MPTAAKLVAAAALAVLMFIVTTNYIPALPEGTQVGYIREIAAGIGFFCGWFFVGPKPGETLAESVSTGIKGAVIAAFWVLMLAAVYTMIRRSMRMMYDGVIEAVLGVFEQLIEFGALIFTPGVLGVLLAGGMVVGVVARGSARRWS